jgi:hypothetical protein
MGVSLSIVKGRLASGKNARGKEEEAREALHIIEKLVRTMKHQFENDSR